MAYPENQNQNEDFDEYEGDDLSGGQEPKPSNRTFFVSFGLIAVIFAITMAALAFVWFYVLPQSREKRESENIQIYAANTATALAATQISERIAMAETVKAEQPTATVAPTFTPFSKPSEPVETLEPTQEIIVEEATADPAAAAIGGGNDDPRTATLAALQTQVVSARLTASAGGATTALPQSGMFDGVGLPSLAGFTAVLGLVIFAARKLRSSNK
ncbi:MAG: hypothetical protein WCG34_05080 [Leptolinea sp.]